MTLLFYVNNQSLTVAPSQKDKKVASDSKNYLKAKFVFQTPEWKQGIISALFTYDGKTYRKIIGAEKEIEYNECFVAPEVIKPGKFTVSLFCDTENGRVTTNKLEISVLDSGYTEDIVNQENTPSVMEQINDLMYNYATICNNILTECQKIENNLKEGK